MNVRPRRGVFWPLLLIALGLVFLLQNFGLVSGISWLAIASLWPLLLILIGLDIAFAHRWPLATLAAELVVIVAGLALAAYAPNLSPGIIVFSSGAGTGSADVSAPRSSGVSKLDLTVNAGAVHAYRLSGGATELVEAHSTDSNLRLRTTTRGDTASVHLDQVAPAGIFRPTNTGEIDVRVASDVPTTLTLNAGAGEFDVDLSDAHLLSARMNVGASSMQFLLPMPSGDVTIRIDGGASSLTITIPEDAEAMVTTSGGLLSLRNDNPRLGNGSDAAGCLACKSSLSTHGYSAAHDRLTITVTAGASSIVVH